MRALFFILLTTFLLVGCGKDPEVAKQKKIDKAVDELIEEMAPSVNQIVSSLESLKDYSEKLQLPEVKEYRRSVEKYSEDYYQEYLKLVPKEFQYEKPQKTEKFIKFQKIFSVLNDEYKDVEKIFEKALETKNYSVFEHEIKNELKIAEQINELVSDDFEWYHENDDVPMYELGKLRQIAKALKFKTLIEVHKGNFEKVKEFFIKSRLFTTKCWSIRGPFVVKLVMNAVQLINYSIVHELVQRDLLALNQFKQLKTMQKSFNAPANLDYLDMLTSEIHRDINWCAIIKSGQIDYVIMDLSVMTLFEEKPEETLEWIKKELSKKENFDQGKFLRGNLKFYLALQKDFFSKVSIKKLTSQEILNEMLRGEKTAFSEIRRLTLKTYANAVKKNNIVYTRYEIKELLLGIKIYEKKHNKLPENMSSLLDEYISKVPVDYNTGLPVKYNKEKREIIIQGVGDFERSIPF